MKVENERGSSPQAVGHKVAPKHPTHPNDIRTADPAQASEERVKAQGDVVELNSKAGSPIEERKEEHHSGAQRIEQANRNRRTARSEVSEKRIQEEAISNVYERINLQKEKVKARVEGREAEEKEIDRQLRTKAGKNLDLLA